MDEKPKGITVRLEREAHDSLTALAKLHHRSLSGEAAEAIAVYIRMRYQLINQGGVLENVACEQELTSVRVPQDTSAKAHR